MKGHRLTLILSLFFLQGCEERIDVLCQEEMPKMKYGIDVALRVLQPYEERKTRIRSIASVAPQGEARVFRSALNEDQVRNWEEWSRYWLLKVQNYLTVMDEDSARQEGRDRLMKMANELVIFHGYAELGDVQRMLTSAKRLEKAEAEMGKLFCSYARVQGVSGPK